MKVWVLFLVFLQIWWLEPCWRSCLFSGASWVSLWLNRWENDLIFKYQLFPFLMVWCRKYPTFQLLDNFSWQNGPQTSCPLWFVLWVQTPARWVSYLSSGPFMWKSLENRLGFITDHECFSFSSSGISLQPAPRWMQSCSRLLLNHHAGSKLQLQLQQQQQLQQLQLQL